MIKAKKIFHNKLGFTLIELLVVISIIGILSGITMLIINPTRVQNRARNATVKSSLSKLSYAVNSARAALGTLPAGSAVLSEFENASLAAGGCTGSTIACYFTLGGVTLPSTCAANSYTGTSSSGDACSFYIFAVSSLTDGKFRIVARKYNEDGGTGDGNIYVQDSSLGTKVCPAGATITSATLPATCVNE